MSKNNQDTSLEIVENTAALAKLKIADMEKEFVRQKIEKILKLYEVMNDCDTNSINLVDQQVTLLSQLRDDQITEDDITEHLRTHFGSFNPDRGMFEVPKVIED